MVVEDCRRLAAPGGFDRPAIDLSIGRHETFQSAGRALLGRLYARLVAPGLVGALAGRPAIPIHHHHHAGELGVRGNRTRESDYSISMPTMRQKTGSAMILTPYARAFLAFPDMESGSAATRKSSFLVTPFLTVIPRVVAISSA